MKNPVIVSTKQIKDLEEMRQIIHQWTKAFKEIKGVEVSELMYAIEVSFPGDVNLLLKNEKSHSIYFSFNDARARLTPCDITPHEHYIVRSFFGLSNTNNGYFSNWQEAYGQLVKWMSYLSNKIEPIKSNQ